MLVSFWGAGRHFSPSEVPVASFGAPLGALWVRSRCYFCVFGRPFDVGPVSVLFGVGRDVRSVHACACFVRDRLIKKTAF